MIHKVYLCDSDSVFDVFAFEKAFTRNEIGITTKAELIDILQEVMWQVDIYKASIKEPKAPKAKKIKGTTWSQDLMNKNPNSKWITYNNNHLLIKVFKDGTGRVIFSANPSFEHLRIVPKTNAEFEKIKKEKSKTEAKRRAQKDVTVEEMKIEKIKKKAASIKRKELQTKLREKMAEILGGEGKKLSIKEIKDIEKNATKKARKMVDREHKKEQREILGQIESATEHMDENAKKRADAALVEAAQKRLSEDGKGEIVDRPLVTKVGDKGTDRRIDLLYKKMSIDDAMEIVTAKANQKSELDKIKDEFKSDMVIPKGNLEITATQGIGIVNSENLEEDLGEIRDKAVAAAIKTEENRIRANLNSELYSALEKRDGKKSTVKSMGMGAKETVNAMAGVYMEGAALSDEVIDFIGVNNSARVLAASMSTHKDSEQIKKKIEDDLISRSKDVVKDVVGTLKSKEERIISYQEQKEDGTIAQATGQAAIARTTGAICTELGFAIGSLETAATVLDSMRDIEGAKGDIVVDGGKSISKLKERLTNMGLEKDDYIISKSTSKSKRSNETEEQFKKRQNRFEVIIKKESASKMLSENTFTNQRKAMVAAIKTGDKKVIQEGWNPKGTPKTFVDFKTSKEMKSIRKEIAMLEAKEKAGTIGNNEAKNLSEFKEYKPYKSIRGQAGFSSEHLGETLYGRTLDIRTQEHQQKMIKIGLEQKRVVWNAGAGTGKTFAFLGMISEIKEKGKLDKSFSVMSPPSRLVKEFFKDAEKFYPNIKMVNLDDVKGLKAKQEVIAYAGRGEPHPKYGKIDVIISGHDSIKVGIGNTKEYVTAKQGDYADKLRAEGKWTDFSWKSKEGKNLIKEWDEEAKSNVGIPSDISKANPTFVGIDEAHEVFKGASGKSSQRQEAIKTIIKNAEYFIPATGTVVRNNMDELGNLLHLTNPEEFPNAKAYGKKWKNVNQHTGVYQSQAVDAMANESDNSMITIALNLKGKKNEDGTRRPAPKYHKKEYRVELSSVQKKQYSKNEEIYRQDRDATGYGVVNNETGELSMKGKNIMNIDDIPFVLTSKDALKGGQSPKHISWLKEHGYKPTINDKGKEEYNVRVVPLGGRNGAAMRRDQRHARAIDGGNYKTNAKALKMMEKIKSYDSDKKHIIYYRNSWSKKMLTSMIKDGLGHDASQIAYIDGGLSKVKRQVMVEKFQNDDNVKFIVMNKAGMTGLNLQRGDVQHFLTRPDSYAEQVQAGARSFRTGRYDDVDAYFYDSNTIVDDRKVDLINKKKGFTEAVRETRARKKK